MRVVYELVVGVWYVVYDHGPSLLWDLLSGAFFRPVGSSLRERYPPSPSAFVTHYSSVDLPEEAFVKESRKF